MKEKQYRNDQKLSILVFVVWALEHMKKMFLKEQGHIGYRVLVADGCMKTMQKSAALIQMEKSAFAMSVFSS